MPESRRSGSSTRRIVPPHGNPKRRASSALTPYVTTSQRVCWKPSWRIRSIRSSSMQPPETDPAANPSSRTASIAPSGRGELPHVFTTVTSSARWPASSHSSHFFNTSRSTLSIVVLRPPRSAVSAHVQDDQHDGDRNDRHITYPRRPAGRRDRRRRVVIGHDARLNNSRCRTGRARDEAREEIVRHLRGSTIDEPRADLRELAADLRLRDVRHLRLVVGKRLQRDARIAARKPCGTALSVELQRVAFRLPDVGHRHAPVEAR